LAAGISYQEMKEQLAILRRQSEGLEDACAKYNASGTRDALERITSTSLRVKDAAARLEEWHR
jgi:hypothetical protein